MMKEIPLARRAGTPFVKAIPSSRVMTFAVTLANPGDLKNILRLEEELALYLQVPVIRMQRHRGVVLIEVPLPRDQWTFIDAHQMKGGEGLRIPLGMTTLRTPVYVTVNADAVAPLLIAGRTGSGKTECMRTILYRLAIQNTPERVKFVIYDPKRKFEAIYRLPHLLLPLCHTPKDAMIALSWLNDLMQKRGTQDESRSPLIVCVIDELIDLMDHNEELAKEFIGGMARLGRELGICLIMGTQRPSRKYMDSITAANIGARIVGRVPDTSEATTATGLGGSGANHLMNKGDMLIVGTDGMFRIQVALTSMRHFAGLEQTDAPPPMPSVEGEGGLLTNSVIPDYTAVEYATALTDIGIIAMKQELNMGQPRATTLRRWAVPVLDALDNLGYNVVPVSPDDDEGAEEANTQEVQDVPS